MNELNHDIDDDAIDNEFIDPEQLIYLNKVYQIKRNTLTNYRIDWQDRKICSYRINPNIQQDFNVQWLGFNHEFNCH